MRHLHPSSVFLLEVSSTNVARVMSARFWKPKQHKITEDAFFANKALFKHNSPFIVHFFHVSNRFHDK